MDGSGGLSSALLCLDNLAVAPPGHAGAILSGVDLRVGAGERIALLGPSGSGKTSLLRTLNGLARPHSGRVWFGGADIGTLRGPALRALRRQIGFVAQKHDLVEPLAVHQNVMAGALGRWGNGRALRYLVWPRRAELDEAEAALRAVGLAHKLRSPTRALSGGEQQRVAIARAVLQAPRLLLADEPVASLDPATSASILDLLTTIARDRGMALLCSLHQPELAARYFDRVLLVENGALRPHLVD
ncbi:MAG TPA: ATP-binding cassette domain-containing protein [Rhodopila sp.]|nr:ATP-binding cassette domain-containing protein [Rhodopila sp.]